MRAAPAFEIDLPPGRLERLLGALLHASVGAVLVAWGLASSAAALDPRSAVLATALASLLAAMWGAWSCRPPQGRLRWDGQRWCWLPAGAAEAHPLHDLRPMIDLGGWLLLQAVGPRPGRGWIVVSRGSAAAAWPALRLALFGPRVESTAASAS